MYNRKAASVVIKRSPAFKIGVALKEWFVIERYKLVKDTLAVKFCQAINRQAVVG